MCGIVGLFGASFQIEPSRSVEKVRAAVDSMHHRGPDDSFADNVADSGAWGMCRLAIRDYSVAGRQPFWQGVIGLIFNGEIYNTDQLRSLLAARGYSFSTHCDTEVLIKTYAEFGTAAFSMLDGIFAIAAINKQTRELVLARDEFGVKPLFVSERNESFAFGSEPKALEQVGMLGAPDVGRLVKYLRYQYVPEPETAWVDVRKVRRGTAEVFSLESNKLLRVESFQQRGEDLPIGLASPLEWVERTEAAIELSVQREMVSDRPLGVFLSGGIDSTLVSYYASRSHSGLKAFGISVPGWERDERKFMEEACAHLDVDLTVADFTEEDFDRLTDKLLWTYDEPFADFSALPTMRVAEVAGRDLTVVLSGDGGDELFGGYTRYDYAIIAQRLGMFSPAVLAVVETLMSLTGHGPAWIVGRIMDERRARGHGYAGMLALRGSQEAAELLSMRRHQATALAPAGSSRRSIGNDSALQTAMSIDLDQYLPGDILTKVDRATMAVSLEARVPLLGAPVARLAEAMPVAIKMNDGIRKWPLKEILRRRGFTDEFVDRPKTGFSFPMSQWLREALKRRADYEGLLRNPPAPLDAEHSRAALEGLMSGVDSGHAVWSLLVLSAWLTRFKV